MSCLNGVEMAPLLGSESEDYEIFGINIHDRTGKMDYFNAKIDKSGDENLITDNGIEQLRNARRHQAAGTPRVAEVDLKWSRAEGPDSKTHVGTFRVVPDRCIAGVDVLLVPPGSQPDVVPRSSSHTNIGNATQRDPDLSPEPATSVNHSSKRDDYRCESSNPKRAFGKGKRQFFSRIAKAVAELFNLEVSRKKASDKRK